MKEDTVEEYQGTCVKRFSVQGGDGIGVENYAIHLFIDTDDHSEIFKREYEPGAIQAKLTSKMAFSNCVVATVGDLEVGRMTIHCEGRFMELGFISSVPGFSVEDLITADKDTFGYEQIIFCKWLDFTRKKEKENEAPPA